MKKNIVFFLSFLFLIGLGLAPLHVQADEASNESYAISIQKYKLSDSALLSTDLPMDGTKLDKVTDGNSG